jgi:hypothetical protein
MSDKGKEHEPAPPPKPRNLTVLRSILTLGLHSPRTVGMAATEVRHIVNAGTPESNPLAIPPAK